MSFKSDAKTAGFTDAQINFMEQWLAFEGHQHSIDDVVGLEEALECAEDDEEEEEE